MSEENLEEILSSQEPIKLIDAINSLKEFIDSETDRAVKLEGEKREEFLRYFGIEDPAEIYYNSNSLILTDLLDYEDVKNRLGTHEEVIHIRIPEFNSYLHIIEIINDRKVCDILKINNLDEAISTEGVTLDESI